MIKTISLNLLVAIGFAFVGYVYGRVSAWSDIKMWNPARVQPNLRRLQEENKRLKNELASKSLRPKPTKSNRSKPTDREIYNYAESQFKKLDSKTDYKRATALNDFDAIDRMEEKVLRDIASHFGISEMEVQQARFRGSRR